MDSCHGCRFFVHGAVIGQCRRYPAIVNKHHTDWCGDFAGVAQRERVMHQAQDTAPAVTVNLQPPKRRGRPPKPRPE